MRDLTCIDGAPLEKNLAQRYFDGLPESARAFLDRLEAEAESERASDESRQQALAASRAELAEAEAQRDAFKHVVQEGGKENVVRLAVLEKRVRNAREQLHALGSAQTAPANIDPAVLMSGVFRAGLKSWSEARADAPALGDGETLNDALDQIREKIAAAQTRIKEIASAILPLADVHKMIDQEIRRIATAGDSYIESLFSGLVTEGKDGGSPIIQSALLQKPEVLLHCFRDRVADAFRLAAQAKFEQLKQDGREVIPNDLRCDVARKAEEYLLALERQEAAILRQLDGKRLAIRRRDMSFPAALEIE